jgi:biopolymer transport protein ExbD
MAVTIDKGRALEALNITPLIDVVFLLLIFFLVATRFADDDRELDVVLPSASEAQPLVAKPKELFVNVDQTGRFFVGGQVVSAAELERVLLRAAENNPVNQSVIIRADKRCQFDFVVQVMNLCNKAQIRDYSVTTADD